MRKRRPAIPITSREFVYVPSHSTDLRTTFARIRAEYEQQQARERAGIVPIKRRKVAS